MAFSGLAFGLPFVMNSVEGTEASLFVAAAAARSSWRRAMIAVAAGAVTMLPLAGLLWLAFYFINTSYLDYAIAFLVFALGVRELREGLKERPKTEGALSGPAEPIGLAPSSAQSIKSFQQRHGLEPSGIIDDRTRAALLAARREAGYEGVDTYLVGVDVADRTAVEGFQVRHGLAATGVVGAATQGALRVAQQPGLLDPLDPEAVRRFQRDQHLPPTGDIDNTTAVALAARRAEAGGTGGSLQQRGTPPPDAATAHGKFDPTDPESVRQLQRSLELPTSGVVDERTRGAVLALRARLSFDPTDVEGLRVYQRRHGLNPTAVLDASTRRMLLDGWRSRPSDAKQGLPDPANREAICGFQRRYGLPVTGTVDQGTQAAMRYERDWFVGLDPTDTRSIREFQERTGLPQDGVIGPATQAAWRAVRTERMAHDRKERSRRYGPVATANGVGPRIDIDLTDPEVVGRFQAEHGLKLTGTVDRDTQEALAVVRRSTLKAGNTGPMPARGPLERLRRLLGDAWPAYVGVVLETSEALLYSFAVASSSFALVPAVIGAGVGYSWPWTVLPLLRRVSERMAEWKQEAGIGLILMGVAASFGLLHALGVFGG